VIEPTYFQVTCGLAARTSREIQNFKKDSHLQASSRIKEKLIKGSKPERVLIAIILKHYYSTHLVSLSATGLDKLSRIVNSGRKVELCFTCTFQETGTLKGLFNQKKSLTSFEIIKGYLLGKFWPSQTAACHYASWSVHVDLLIVVNIRTRFKQVNNKCHYRASQWSLNATVTFITCG
jgi:hypothetical protein